MQDRARVGYFDCRLRFAPGDSSRPRDVEGGQVTMPLANAPWGPYFGMCVDRFGVQWMVSLSTPV